MIHFITGGQRSGKSLFAENSAKTLATQNGCGLIYLATAELIDDEMQARIDAHVKRRGPEWHLMEVPIKLATAVKNLDKKTVGLVDCLGVWVANLLYHKIDIKMLNAKFLHALDNLSSDIVIVSSETGLGVIPNHAEIRHFNDILGELNQQIAARADQVDLIISGLPICLKSCKRETL